MTLAIATSALVANAYVVWSMRLNRRRLSMTTALAGSLTPSSVSSIIPAMGTIYATERC